MRQTTVKRIRATAVRQRWGTALGIANRPDELLRLYGNSDKRTHGYLPHYRTHLGPRRFSRGTVYEIGVGEYESLTPGGSLALWRDFLPRSTIIGIDIHPKEVHLGHRVKFARADQNDPVQLLDIVARHGAPDVVVDDGSHVGEHIVTSFQTLWPHLRSGGIYVVEDLATSFSEHFGGAHPPPTMSGVGLTQRLISDVQATDPGFVMWPSFADPPVASYGDVASVHAYPGITFIHKA